MFPNPQDALALPPRPNLEQYKKQAKDLVKACKSGDADAIRAWTVKWIETLVGLQGTTITPEVRASFDRCVDQVEEFARSKLSSAGRRGVTCALADAQFVIARAHGFESWPKLVKHIDGLGLASSPVSKFELAADVIVTGDVAVLEQMLRDDPELIRVRSTREHKATLLHYVSANGVEGYRQRTPKNAVKVAEVLLKAGAEVDAEANVYGGGSTTLGLVATSIHPFRAGVQDALLEILLDHGAAFDGAPKGHSVVVQCLANGCPGAGVFLAGRGAQLGLEGAAGLGRLDVVESFFNEDGSLKPSATKQQLLEGFLWACGYGHNNVVEFLLGTGIDIAAQGRDGQTGLHWAAIGGKLDTIRVLIERGAPLEVRNVYGGTVLSQALWSAINGDPGIDYVPILETLLTAGAEIGPGWLTWLAQEEGRSPSAKSRIAEVFERHGAKS
jgi:hypothetical protein